MKVQNTDSSQSPKDLNEELSADSTIMEISRSWTPEQWEQYLKKTEGPLKEDLLSENHYDRIADESEISIFDYAQTSASLAITERVRTAVSSLTDRQRQVVELIFFKLKSERQTGLELGIDRSSVRKHKRKAIKNLRKTILRGAPTSPLSRGSKEKSGGIK